MINLRRLLFLMLIIVGIVATFSAYTVSIACIISPVSIVAAIQAMREKQTRWTLARLVLSSVLFIRMIWILVTVNYADFAAAHRIVEYHLPRDFSGWVTVTYDVEDAKALDTHREVFTRRYILEIPADGLLMTSNGQIDEAYTPEYYGADDKEISAVTTDDKVTIACEHGDESHFYFYVLPEPTLLEEVAPICETAPDNSG